MNRKITHASHDITNAGLKKFNDLVRAGKSPDVAYAQARAANNTAFTRFLRSLGWKRPEDADPMIGDIEYMGRDPGIGGAVQQAEQARESGNRRLFVLLRGKDGVAATNKMREALGEPPIKADDLAIEETAKEFTEHTKV